MKQFLNYAAEQYYAGTPIISDAEFDMLAEKYGYNIVGARSIDEVPHLYPMFSLKKCFDTKEIPPNLDVSSPKLDGAAVSIIYVNGQLALGLTRGDGKKGNDITAKIAHLVPTTIPCSTTVQITGEVVAPKTIENARNYASGSLGLKSEEEFVSRLPNLAFIAYDCSPNQEAKWTHQMNWLFGCGFNVVTEGIEALEEYPLDGVVYRINEYDKFFAAGYTAHHPKGAIALKEVKIGKATTLLDVIWQVGKSGVVSPVAIFTPVDIDGAIVSRATLHNIEYIEGLELEIGCQIEVIRSGEIIPRVVRKL